MPQIVKHRFHVLLMLVISACVYVVLRELLGPTRLLIVENGVFYGCGLAYVIAFGDLLVDSVFGRTPYDRVRQMALGIFLAYAAIGITVFGSVYSFTVDAVHPPAEWVPFGRFVAIASGVMQIFAPDYGNSLLYGRDRKLLVGASLAGLCIAIIIIMLQA